MAEITITVGSLTANISGNDSKARELLPYFVEATGGPTAGTNQEKLDWIANRLRHYLVEVVHGEKRRLAVEIARADVDANPPEF